MKKRRKWSNISVKKYQKSPMFGVKSGTDNLECNMSNMVKVITKILYTLLILHYNTCTAAEFVITSTSHMHYGKQYILSLVWTRISLKSFSVHIFIFRADKILSSTALSHHCTFCSWQRYSKLEKNFTTVNNTGKSKADLKAGNLLMLKRLVTFYCWSSYFQTWFCHYFS